MDTILGLASLIAAIIIVFLQLRQADRTKHLEQEMYRIYRETRQSDEVRQTQEIKQLADARQAEDSKQSLNMLFKARDAAIVWQRNQVFLTEYMRHVEQREHIDWGVYASRQADLTAAWAELRGMAMVIGDEALNNLVQDGVNSDRNPVELDLRNKAQKIHTRIAELMAQEMVKS